jgi:translin
LHQSELAIVDELDNIVQTIDDILEGLNQAREATLKHTRRLIRECANTIRAIHRGEWDKAQQGLQQAQVIVDALMKEVEGYPELYHSGYTSDALKEYAEAHLTYALVRGETLPSHTDLNIDPAVYLNGLAEAATELRRTILDVIRHQHDDEAERLLDVMDVIYTHLTTIDFTDAITKGLRRRTDIVRNVLERTRGDVTTSLRQQQLEEALEGLERKLQLNHLSDSP